MIDRVRCCWTCRGIHELIDEGEKYTDAGIAIIKDAIRTRSGQFAKYEFDERG